MIRRADLPQEFRERFWSKVTRGTGCWKWQGAENSTGYGQTRFGDIKLLAHRVAFVLARRGFVRGHEVIDHLCAHPWCVRPEHLRVTRQRNNWLRGRSPTAVCVRTGWCLSGKHRMDDAYRFRGSWGRACRQCYNAHARTYRAKHRDAINAKARAKYARTKRRGAA